MSRCIQCGAELQPDLCGEEPASCQQCGAHERHLVRVVNESLSVVERWRAKLKGAPGRRGRRAREMDQGHDLTCSSSRWNYLYRLIDRVANRYHERITDPLTGKVIHEVEEPLRQHQGRGSARRPPPRSDEHSV
jgi:hypothetical protein